MVDLTISPEASLRGFTGVRAAGQVGPHRHGCWFRVQMGAHSEETQKLADNLPLLSGPGGHVVVLDGRDRKLVVDTFASPAWPKLKETLDGMGKMRKGFSHTAFAG